MPVKIVELANALIMHDDSAECPFCEKKEWGEEKHAEKCPFGLAYLALNEQRPTKRAVDLKPHKRVKVKSRKASSH